MRIIDYNSLKISKQAFSSGSFGKIYECLYNGSIYAYKEFEDVTFLHGKKQKLNRINKIDEDFLVTPQFWIKKDGKTSGYLTKLLNGKDLAFLEEYDLRYKVQILDNIKHEIKKMHSYGIIHSDISSSNIIMENNIPYFIDFDNCSFNNSPIKISDTSIRAKEFIKKYGVIKELDIFLFNLLTFELVNECNYNLIRKNIILNNYGSFDNSASKEICESFFLEGEIPEKRFLIDKIK